MKRILIALSLVAAAPLACTTNDGGATAAELMGRHCSWPSSLDGAGSGGCTAAAALAECTNAAGEGCGCLSDNSLTCDGCQAAGAICKDVCAVNQYTVACGGVGPSAGGTPPAGCVFAEANPGGVAYYCCPCQ